MDESREKSQQHHHDLGTTTEPLATHSEDVTGFEADETTLKPGYFTSSFFLGSMTAICLGLFAGVSGFAYAAPILTIGTSTKSSL